MGNPIPGESLGNMMFFIFFWEILKQFQDKPLVGVGVKPIFRNGEVEKPIEKWTVVDYERLRRCRSH